MFKALFESFWQGISIVRIPDPRRPAPTGEQIIELAHRLVLDLLEFVQDDGLDTHACTSSRLLASRLLAGPPDRSPCATTGSRQSRRKSGLVRQSPRRQVDCQSLDPIDPRRVLQGMNLLKGRAAVCLQLSLPLLPDLEGNEFVMSQLLSLEEFPFGRHF